MKLSILSRGLISIGLKISDHKMNPTMAVLELRSQLEEKRGLLLRQVEEERRRVASFEQESAQVHYNYDIHNYKHCKQGWCKECCKLVFIQII